MDSDSTELEVSRIGGGLARRVNDLGSAVAATVRSEVAFYRENDVVSQDELIESCTDNARFIVAGLVGTQSFDTTPAAMTGDARARAGVPLPAVMAAYRVGSHHIWQALHELSDADAGISVRALLAVTAQIWTAQDVYTEAMVTAYRERAARQALEEYARRTAFIDALFTGCSPSGRSLWDIADLLGLPTRGPYAVVAAATPEPGRRALPGTEHKLRSLEIYSAWRLLPDVEIGIASLGSSDAQTNLLAAVTRANETRIGVSPPFDDLADIASAVRYARIALDSATEHRPVVVFDGNVLAVAAVSDPHVGRRLAAQVLGQLNTLGPDERQILVDTFRSWVAHRGSLTETATAIYCHPNTVRYRLHRIEDYTGRSVTAPHDVAELCLAFEIDTWLR